MNVGTKTFYIITSFAISVLGVFLSILSRLIETISNHVVRAMHRNRQSPAKIDIDVGCNRRKYDKFLSKSISCGVTTLILRSTK